MEHKKTEIGFDISEFKDTYGQMCSLQHSSIATDDRIWFGVNDGNPMIMASQAKQYGIDPVDGAGWVKFPIPDDVLISTRMHLNREQVSELIPYLQSFIETGTLMSPTKEKQDNRFFLVNETYKLLIDLIRCGDFYGSAIEIDSHVENPIDGDEFKDRIDSLVGKLSKHI